MDRLKVMTILGTRPEIIRLSRVMCTLDEHVHHIITHTGQNWDYELNEIFFEDLGIRKPDHFLGAGGGSLGETLGKILANTEEVLASEQPDAVLVLGDTNSALSALMARRMKVPIYHMEAGNRSFDKNVPEETNRKIIDHISDFNLVYTEHARRHLLSEGLPHRRIHLTGSPMREVLKFYNEKIQQSNILEKLSLEEKRYFIASIHREENVDDPTRLIEIAKALNGVSERYGYPIILSTHPRTQDRLDKMNFRLSSAVKVLKPFGFSDYNKLQCKAYCAISDSGTIAEESSILNFPAVSPRDAIERPEALDTGSLMISELSEFSILNGIRTAVQFHNDHQKTNNVPVDYKIENTSERVVKLILSTAKLSNKWDGIRAYR